VNVDECLMRLRFGKVVFLARQLFGRAVSLNQCLHCCLTVLDKGSHLRLKQGEEIVQIVLDHGKLRLPDILSLLGIYDQKGKE
jgi:DNA-directed RNA polymerase III subunit RPC3